MFFYYERKLETNRSEQPCIRAASAEEAVAALAARYDDLLVVYTEDFNIVWRSAT